VNRVSIEEIRGTVAAKLPSALPHTVDELCSELMLARAAKLSQFGDRAPAGRPCGELLEETVWRAIEGAIATYGDEERASIKADIERIVSDVVERKRAPPLTAVKHVKGV
jgi:hypothetical protein